MRHVNAPLKIVFNVDDNSKVFKREYDLLSSTNDDSIGEWLRLAKSRGATEDSDQVLLTLVVELHRKIDEMSAFMRGEKQVFISLTCRGDIEFIDYGCFKLKDALFKENVEYYGRIEMPFFPKRQVPIYFKAISKDEAKMTMLHERDEKDWNAYIVARERVMIREMRVKKDGN